MKRRNFLTLMGIAGFGTAFFENLKRLSSLLKDHGLNFSIIARLKANTGTKY
jgi:hypothetical protein